jgi:hypothetical protein
MLKQEQEHIKKFLILFRLVKGKVGVIYTSLSYTILYPKKRISDKCHSKFKKIFKDKVTINFRNSTDHIDSYSLKRKEYFIRIKDKRVNYINLRELVD